jgi:hypothetical protein
MTTNMFLSFDFAMMFVICGILMLIIRVKDRTITTLEETIDRYQRKYYETLKEYEMMRDERNDWRSKWKLERTFQTHGTVAATRELTAEELAEWLSQDPKEPSIEDTAYQAGHQIGILSHPIRWTRGEVENG